MCLTVLIAPSGFKECLSAREAADAMAAGVRRAWPRARILTTPIADGGEGFTSALVEATRGRLHRVTVTGPTGTPVTAHVGILGHSPRQSHTRTAVIDIASAAGLALVPHDQRDPTVTSSYGVGELLRAALDLDAKRIIVGCGDSGVNDGGAGMAQALGARLLDDRNRDIDPGGAALLKLARIGLSGLDPRLAHVQIDAAVNQHNALLGTRGVSRIYGPQKGARPEQIPVLERALAHYAARLLEATGADVTGLSGAGASGGIGAGLAAICGAALLPRYDLVMHYTSFARLLADADLVLTAEGGLDDQTPHGKIPAEVGRRAEALNIPVIALAGCIGQGADINLAHGITAYRSILARPCSLADATHNAASLLSEAAEHIVRTVAIGLTIAKRRAEPRTEPLRCCA